MQGRDGFIDRCCESGSTGARQHSLEKLRSAGAAGTVNQIRKRDGLSEDESSAEKRFHARAVTYGVDVRPKLEDVSAGDEREVLSQLPRAFHHTARKNEVPSEKAEAVDVDRRTVRVGRV